VELTDAERRVLERLRDEDERFEGADRRVREGRQRRGLILSTIPHLAGQPGKERFSIMGPGREALGPAER
jgi:hypothetical protein